MLSMASQPKASRRSGGESMTEPLRDPPQHETFDVSEMGDVTELSIQRRLLPVSGLLASDSAVNNPLSGAGRAQFQFQTASAVWKAEFGCDHLVVPALKDLTANLRPRGANPMDGGGRSHRRVMAFFLQQVRT